MTKLTKAFFACIVVVACKQASEVKVAQNRDPILSTVTKLFTKLIGRPPHATEIQEYRDAIEKPEYQGKAYPAILTTLLASEAYWREGFYHLHRNRLLIDDSSELFQSKAENDLQSLKLELADVAKSKHYWDILTYRERWLPVFYDPLLEQCAGLSSTSNNSEEEEPTCRSRIKAEILPEQPEQPEPPEPPEPPEYPEQPEQPEQNGGYRSYSIYNHYANQCCTQSPDPSYCRELDRKYQGLFGKRFCDVKDNENVDWNDEQLKNAIFLYASMDFNRGLDGINASRFFMFEVPELGSQREDLFLRDPDSGKTFIKVRMTEDVQGVHANPYWLSRHRTTSKNRHLHRARIISLSWFCEDISPDAATKYGQQPTRLQLLKFRNYFATDDKHATSDQACFNCHKRIQPIANYFGKMSMGTNYSIESAPDDLLRRFFAEKKDAFERPGVYYDPQQGKFFDPDSKLFFSYHDSLIYYRDKDRYYDVSKKKYLQPDEASTNPLESHGLGGLAAIISSLPRVKKCVVESTWNTIFGSEWRLGSNEVDEAISAFEQYGYDYSKLLEHLLTKKKAEIFFSAADGEKRFQEMVAVEKEKLACSNMRELVGDISLAAKDLFQKNCTSCHCEQCEDSKEYNEPLFNKDGSFVENVNMEAMRFKIRFDEMPPSGYEKNKKLNADQQRKILLCFLDEKIGSDIALEKKQEEDFSTMHSLENEL